MPDTNPINCFVTPDVARLQLNGPFTGLWLDVKAELSWGEQQRLTGTMLRATHAGGDDGPPEVIIDTARHSFETMRAWLLDWNLTDATGKQVPYTPGVVENLRGPIAAAILAAIQAHAVASDEKKEAAATNGSSKAG